MGALPAVRLALAAGLATGFAAVVSSPLGAEPAGFVVPEPFRPAASVTAPPGGDTSVDGNAFRASKAGRRKPARRAAHLAASSPDDERKSARSLGLVAMLAAAAGTVAARSREHLPPLAASRPVFARWRRRMFAATIAVLAASGFLMLYGPDWLAPLTGGNVFSTLHLAARTAHAVLGAALVLALVVMLASRARTPLRGAWLILRGAGDPLADLAARAAAAAERISLADIGAFAAAKLPAAAIAVLAVTGTAKLVPYEINLFQMAHDVASGAGLPVPPVTLWRDMELTTLTHIAAGFVLIVALPLRRLAGRHAGRVTSAAAAPRSAAPREGLRGIAPGHDDVTRASA